MAFFSKVGNILRQTINKQHISHEISASSPSVFQILRFMSSSKVFVGGLSWNTSDGSLQEAFRKYGDVIEARVITDRETGRSRGFGFVTFGSTEDAGAAIQAMDGQELDGRSVRVNYANEKPRGGGYGGGGYGGGGGGYGGGGYGSGGYGGGGGSYGGGGGSMSYGGGGDSYADGGATGSNTFSSSGFEGNTGFGYGENQSSEAGEAGSQGFPGAGSYRDDDDQPDDYAKRA